MPETKEKYLVVMYLPWQGKVHGVGDFIYLTPDEARRVPSHRIEKVAPVGQSIDDDFDPARGSAGNDAKDAVAYIEQADEEQLEGFLSDSEDRITVLRAWDQRFDTNYSDDA